MIKTFMIKNLKVITTNITAIVVSTKLRMEKFWEVNLLSMKINLIYVVFVKNIETRMR